MFESDDFDQVLSQFEFPEAASTHSILDKSNDPDESNLCKPGHPETPVFKKPDRLTTTNTILIENVNKDSSQDVNKVKKHSDLKRTELMSPKHTKRKIINSYFDHQNKRKFPGPAGILTGVLEEPKDDSICQMELLSQDIDCTDHNLQRDLFVSPIWKRLLNDAQSWGLQDIDSIKGIKMQAVAGNLRRRKAQSVTAFVEAVDRSATDPLIILRDSTGSIKCTLHRDAWSTFSAYIVSEYCALVLQKPTVLTTGSAFKKHYLNITLSNILAIYSSTVLDEDKMLPDGFSIVYQEDFTVIKTERISDGNLDIPMGQGNNCEDLFDGLDSIFTDDAF